MRDRGEAAGVESGLENSLCLALAQTLQMSPSCRLMLQMQLEAICSVPGWMEGSQSNCCVCMCVEWVALTTASRKGDRDDDDDADAVN